MNNLGNEVQLVHVSSERKKFNQCYMLARELGSGAFSTVRLGISKVKNPVVFSSSFDWMSRQLAKTQL